MYCTINGERFESEVLTDQRDLEIGMMGRNYLNGCMVFKMGPGYHSFWMKGCLIPLDMVFISKNKITKIFLDCKPTGNQLNPIKYTGIGDIVIEFPSGTANKWKIGDKVSFNDI